MSLLTPFDPPRGYVTAASLADSLDTPFPRRVLLGFSGGADSRSLLDLLVAEGFEVTPLHVNHMIRGEEAERDEVFCRETAAEYRLDCVTVRADVPAEAVERREGVEEAARNIRYRIFSEVMKERGIGLLATAHNASDNAETFLLNAVRGASARGARGIPMVRPCAGGYVIRPLLRTAREDIVAYCEARGLKYITDSTNADVRYSRNRIRLNVMPELRAVNPGAVEALGRLCEQLEADSALLDSMAAAELEKRRLPDGSIDLSGEIPAPVLGRIIAAAARANRANPESRHIKDIENALSAGRDLQITLPGSVIATLSRGVLAFRKDLREKRVRRTGENQ